MAGHWVMVSVSRMRLLSGNSVLSRHQETISARSGPVEDPLSSQFSHLIQNSWCPARIRARARAFSTNTAQDMTERNNRTRRINFPKNVEPVTMSTSSPGPRAAKKEPGNIAVINVADIASPRIFSY